MQSKLQALCLDIRVLDENGETVDISGVVDDETPSYNNIEEVERSVDAEAENADSAEDEDFDDDFADEDGEYYDDDEDYEYDDLDGDEE